MHFYCLVYVGQDENESFDNFVRWIDSIVVQTAGESARIICLNGNRSRYFFHQMELQTHCHIKSLLSDMTEWAGQIHTAGIDTHSCGQIFSIVGGGTGTCQFIHLRLGPFQTRGDD